MSTFLISDPRYREHLTGPWHPESPSRLEAIERVLSSLSLLHLKPRMATREELLLCHMEEYIALVEREAERCEGVETLSTGDTPICRASYEVALLAVGGLLRGLEAIFSGMARNGFCAVRPPGHHACRERGMGFCLFNNIAIAARVAQKEYGAKRVLIVDFDVHHGNGTQDIFYDDPTVFYFSTHEWPHYPGTGSVEEKGCGNIFNHLIGAGPRSRERVLEAFHKPLEAVAALAKPDLVLVSAGFDGHEVDPLGGFNLTSEDFYTLTVHIKEIAERYAKGRLLSALEGGYHLEALASSVFKHVTALQREERAVKAPQY